MTDSQIILILLLVIAILVLTTSLALHKAVVYLREIQIDTKFIYIKLSDIDTNAGEYYAWRRAQSRRI